MKNTLFRLGHMLLGWGTVGVVYSLTDRLQGAGTLLPPSALDRAIPFNPAAIWLYLSFFLIVPAGYLLAPLRRIKWLTLAMQLTALERFTCCGRPPWPIRRTMALGSARSCWRR
jgi:hypothetical protein